MNDLVGTPAPGTLQSLEMAGLPLSFQLYLNPALRDQVKALAKDMAEDPIWCPEHLRGKPAACAVVITRAIVWRLDPYAVASQTYMTPGGSIGFEAALVNAAISAHIDGGFHYKHRGDWSRVQGKFAIKESARGTKYQVATWTDKDAEGLGVDISARLKGEREARVLSLDLVQCQPRNSTLWATDPKTQICYTAVRRWASVMAPQALMGLPLPPDAAQPSEINMGEAEVYDAEPDIMQPRPAESVNHDTGEVQRDEPAAHTEASAEPAAQQTPAAAPGLITPNALRILSKKLADKALTEQFCDFFGIADASLLPMARFNEADRWITEWKG